MKSVGGEDDTVDPMLAAIAAAPALSPLGQRLDAPRYNLIRRLGEGGFGVVYEAEDREQGGRVAIKLLRHPHPDWLYRFKREFRAVSEVAHPNLVRLYELGAAGDQWYFTMELVEGEPLLAWVAGSIERLRAALAQLARALRAIHRAGKLHRDVKPSNVLVEPSGRLLLLDFGLVIDLDPNYSTAIAGTPAYMSPEQCAGEALGEASDWYAVGVTLFEALAGRVPYPSALPLLLGAAKQHAEPPDLRTLAPDAPDDLVALCRELMGRDPAARPDGEQILRRLEQGASAAPAEPAGERLFGRDAELAVLHDAFAGLARGGPGVLFVTGSSGAGKSALLHCFLAEVAVRAPSTVVLAGRCYERELVPYRVFDAAIDALAAVLARMPDLDVEGLMPRDAAALALLFPVLRRVHAVERRCAGRAAGGDPAELRRRGMAALRDLLARMADRRPVVFCVDDLQWGDADSALLLWELLRPPDPPALLFLGSCRAEEDVASPFLRRLAELHAAAPFGGPPPAREIALPPLPGSAARALVADVLGERGGDTARADTLVAEAGGNPFLLRELALLAGSGAAAVDVGAVVQARLAPLPAGARRLLEVIALAGGPLETAVAADAAGLADGARDPVTRLRTEHLLRVLPAEPIERLEVYHDRIREHLVAGLTEAERSGLHARIAEALERRGIDDPERLAMHVDGAGQTERAADYLARAARRAAGALAFEHASRLFRSALTRRAPAAPGGAALRVELADALAAAGHCTEAAEVYLAASESGVDLSVPGDAGSPGPGGSAGLRARAAHHLLVAGELARGRAVLREVLGAVGEDLPSSRRSAIRRIIVDGVRLRLRGFDPPGRARPAPSDRDLLRLDALWAAVAGLSPVEPVIGAALVARYACRTRDAGEPWRLLRARAAVAMNASARFGVAAAATVRVHLAAARALAEKIDTTEAWATVLFADGTTALTQGRWRDALDRFDEAEPLLAQAGAATSPELTRVPAWRAAVHMFIGRSGDLARFAPAAFAAYASRGNLLGQTLVGITSAWVMLAGGRASEAREELDRLLTRWPGEPTAMQRFWRDLVELQCQAYSADSGWMAAEAVWRRMKQEGGMAVQFNRIHSTCLRARLALTLARENATERRALLRHAARELARVEREGAPWGDSLALSLRAGLASLRGDADGALALLEQAEPRLEETNNELQLMATRRARGLLIGGDQGAALVATADEWMVAQQVAHPDRWAAAYLPGRWE